MRPDVVVIVTPITKHHPPFTQGVDHFPIQTLGPEPAIEALGITVLPGATRINVDRADIVVLKPLLDDPGNKLRAVVTADELWGSMLLYPFYGYLVIPFSDKTLLMSFNKANEYVDSFAFLGSRKL